MHDVCKQAVGGSKANEAADKDDKAPGLKDSTGKKPRSKIISLGKGSAKGSISSSSSSASPSRSNQMSPQQRQNPKLREPSTRLKVHTTHQLTSSVHNQLA